MTTEQKAKAYDKAINAIKELKAKHPTAHVIKDWIKDNFPELTESKDEKTRKIIKQSLKSYFDGKLSIGTNDVDYAMCLSWLKKQGEQKKSYDTCDSSMMDNKKSPYGEKRDFGYFEEKSADKIEPMFKVGEWIITPNNQIKQIKFITFGNYHFTDGSLYNMIDVDNKGHLWTIQDAKDGDALYHKAENGIEYIVMSKGLNENNNIDSYFRYNSINGFGIDIPSVLSAKCDSITPATKEQRDLLFQKMHEAGYEWDAEKKKLKKIDNEEVNGEDYGIDGLWHAQRILEKTLGSVDGYQTDDGILDHKAAITAVKKLYKQKPTELSEEDEGIIDTIIRDLKRLGGDIVNVKPAYKAEIDWLKSLRPQNTWKPSVEQIEALESATENCAYSEYQDCLRELIGQLKKLKE